ncbi:MAG: hypothetical protein PWQ25_179 [Deferribacteres bacterium]|jgi:hypothetical protein|nr:hypothetical protein [Deferribacteraceae bacterium]MDK2791316.1 hypothetical protein [Deferribacteres bacterium]
MEIKTILEDLERFENLIKIINFEYQQYFIGNKKNPPVVYEREANKIIHKYSLNQINSSTLRFRFNNLVARFVTFREKWNRKMMEMEGIKSAKPKHIPTEKILENNTSKGYESELEKLPPGFDKNKIKGLIEQKLDELKNKGIKDVKIEIEMVDGKPKLRMKKI